jgi:hypothetical protein
MVHYVGLDVSLKQTSICVVNQAGLVVREGVVDSDPELIAAFVRSKAPGALRIGLETGPTTTWLWTELKQFGLPVICIDARHAKALLRPTGMTRGGPLSELKRTCASDPPSSGHDMNILAGPIVLSAVGARPPHDGVR